MLDIAAAAGRIRVPWLLAHGDADESVPVDTAPRLAALSGSGVTELLVIPGAGHTFGIKHPWAGTTPHFEAVLGATVGWLSAALG